MALVLADRVKETSTTTGTGTYTLAGAVTGFESFASIGNGNTTYYACTLGSDFEVGIGTYTASGTTLARTTILQSSNSDNAVNWGAGEKTLFCTQPAEKAVFLDASGHIIALDGRNLTNVDAATLDSIDSGSFLRSDAADTKTSGDLTFSDNVKAVFGAGSDLQIFHDGTNSRIYGTTGDTNIGQNAFGAVKLTADNDQENMLVANVNGSVELYHDNSKKLETASGGISVTGEIAATSLDISGDVDVDGTLEADAMTLNGTAITSTATLSTGISNNNVPKFTSGVADNDFLRVDGTAIEGRSASQVLSDIGGQASLTFGISNTNAVKIDSTSVADDEYARFTASGLESRSNAEVLSDIGAQASLTFGISNTNAVKIDSTSVADDEYARFTANGLESRSTSEVLSDIGGISASSTDTLTNKTLTTPVINGFSGTGDASITGTTTTTSLRLTGTTDVTPSSTGHPLQIGPDNNLNIAIDGNEIQARNNGSVSTLYLNISGGSVNVGPDLALTDTGSGSGEGPTLDIYRNSSSPADQDILGNIVFSGENDAGEKITYGEIQTRIRDVTDGTENGAIETFVETNGSLDLYTVHQDGESQFYKDVQIISNDSGSTENPTLQLYRNSSSPAVNDVIGHIVFSGENDAGEKITYAEIETFIADETDGTEDGSLQIRHIREGVDTLTYASGFGGNFFYKNVFLHTGVNISFEGSTDDANETVLTVTDPTSDRTITLPDASGTVQLTDGSGASLTSLNASQLSSGTVPNARLDAQLQDVAGLAVTNGGFIVGDGSNFVLETGSTARTSLGLGTAATLDTGISNTNIPKFTSGVADNDFLRVDGTSIEGRSASEVLSDIGGISASSTDTLTNKTLTTPVINGFSGTGNGTITGDLTLISTDSGSSDDPSIILYRNSSSQAFGDTMGEIIFRGNNAASGQTAEYATITTKVQGTGNNVENGELNINVLRVGSSIEVASFNYAEVRFKEPVKLDEDVNITFEGSSSNSHETILDVVDPTADRTINLPDASGTVLTTGNSDTPTTTTSSSDADFVLVDDGGTMKKITPANLGITSGGTTAAFATAMAMVL